MPIAAALPSIAAGASLAGTVGSFFRGGKGKVGNTAQGPNDVWPLRQMIMQYLLQGKMPEGSPVSSLTLPGFDSVGNPNSALSSVNTLFDATRAHALGQAKESAGNLTGSGRDNLFGSALATSLAQQQHELGQVGMQGAVGNQQAILNMLMGFGTGGVGTGSPTYTPGWGSQLAGLGGQLGTLAGLFPEKDKEPYRKPT